MNISEYNELALRTAKDLPREKALLHVIAGLAGEIGELADAIKKAEIYNKKLDVDNIAEEISDCLWFVAYAAHVFGFSLETIARMNIEKLARRYPSGFSDYHATARLDKEDGKVT
jgi:NTP pyrophosphatase (non-canonical NTP hydrolase)